MRDTERQSDLAGTSSWAMDECFVDSDHESPGTDPSTSNLSSSGGGQPSPSLCPTDTAPAQPSSDTPGFPLADQVYLGAGAVFQRLRKDRPITHQLLHFGKKVTAPLPEGLNKSGLRQAYQLAFNTLKYQDLLENIIIDSCFHTSQQIDRQFQLIKRPARKGEEPLQDVRDLESCFRRSKTKLAASLARCRVKQNLVSVSCVLPDPVRTNQDRAKLLPFYAWVNTLKSSVEEVCDELQEDLARSEAGRTGGSQGDWTFCRDALCPDTLCFVPQLRALIERSTLATAHVLNVQHRGVCVAVSALRLHLSDRGDVLVAGSFSACTLAHIAVHAAAGSGKVLVCGDDHTPSQRAEMQELLTRMDIKNVRVLPGEFQGLDEWDAAAQRLKVVVLLPRCSSSALSDPVHTLLAEHGDVEVLQDLSQGPVSQSKLDTLVHHQEKLLAHALTLYPQENEHLVKRVLEKTDTPPKLVPFRTARPLFPQTPESDTAESRFFRIEPSGHTDGCFIARVTRELDAPKVESAHDVLARAAAMGLLGDMFGGRSQPGQRAMRRKGRPPAANKKPYSPLLELAESEPVAGQSLGPDNVSRPVPTDTPSTTEAGDEEEDEAAGEEEEYAKEGNEGSPEGERDTGKGLRKGKGKVKRRTKRFHGMAKVSAVQKTVRVKVNPKRGQGPKGRVAGGSRFTPTPSSTPSTVPSGRTSTATPDPNPATSNSQCRAPLTAAAAHVLQVSLANERRGQKIHKTAKKAAKPGSVSKATRAAAAANEEAVAQNPSSPGDPVQPLVSSFSQSSLSNTNASSRSREAASSSSTMSSTPYGVSRTRTPF
ncbi:hypothetical protein NHX12_018536 [Muraenolepis orangiensis]|uniref:SAM-dependent MTase RsmB/NOP-type domain-containing protein n=1 Tax=Muraenolepis orangiensis TaxID=630683 RepID=A0A9Q0IVF6_9TELE|nr:hypothetical protein NHX12_018536 [Muraenolepis orangiensis]